MPPADDLHQFLLRLGDDQLILGHRLSEWCGHAPTLEEDLALANMGLDAIGQARELYAQAARLQGGDASEDSIAYLRNEREYRNLLLVEFPNTDFAYTMLRQFYFAAFMVPYWRTMEESRDAFLRGVAGKAAKEATYHLQHSGEWLVRLGCGTDESARRMRDAVDNLHCYVDEMFETDELLQRLIDAGVAVCPRTVRGDWDARVEEVFARAGLAIPVVSHAKTGGRAGVHSEHLGHLLAEMQWLQRAYPGAKW